MPTDTALPLYLSNEDFVYRSSAPPASRCHSEAAARDGGKVKKQVTFADHRGLPLTRVKVFSQFKDPIDIPLDIRRMASTAPGAKDDKLVLDFGQPSADYVHFRQRLERNCVCLEHCVLKHKALAGTVKVKNLSFEKRVKLRVTFDSWKSHSDVDCTYVKDSYPARYGDTFSFRVSLPKLLPPQQHVEFAVCYQVGGAEYWDSNHGHNYRVLWASARLHRADTRHFDSGIHLDRFGSPTCGRGIFPEWPSYAGYENVGPYY
ncbi:protein phosphatase 1 regulatory subunit 3B [Dunckerocampus dactyliophorus]|uniref:protein phosphatase 1 regulatory subunit 3B n=1 Tax=Dunckerocampus dactyliophorus TaxID=161453 RepID=UPI00240724B5|nr:protein phosphatase 1 regulatory subunit 3B [Dunckerocampus dactyliophorus]XP_054612299.1 protein phosphatase 1 regulatory subunit 3B [Dunckerocampus dactyliophorus]